MQLKLPAWLGGQVGSLLLAAKQFKNQAEN
jgi:hypothetical protein